MGNKKMSVIFIFTWYAATVLFLSYYYIPIVWRESKKTRREKIDLKSG